LRYTENFQICEFFWSKLPTSYPQLVVHKLSTALDFFILVWYYTISYAQVVNKLCTSCVISYQFALILIFPSRIVVYSCLHLFLFTLKNNKNFSRIYIIYMYSIIIEKNFKNFLVSVFYWGNIVFRATFYWILSFYN